MANPFKRENKYIKFAQKNLFTADLHYLLAECKNLVDKLLVDAITLAHGKGFKGQRLIEEELAKKPSDLASRFKSMFYLLYFNEISQVIGPNRSYRIEIGDKHIKFVTKMIEQDPKMLAKLQSDLASFLNHYYRTILEPMESSDSSAVSNRLARFARASQALGFRMISEDRALIRVEPNPEERKRIYDLWYASRKSRFSFSFGKSKSEYSPYLKKLRKKKSIRQLADLVSNKFPFANPTKIKILITFSVIIAEEVSVHLKKMIDAESSMQVRPKSFFNADLKKLSAQIEKENGEYYQQLGKDLNAFLTAIRKGEDRQGRMEPEVEKAQAEHWSKMKKAVEALGFSYTLSPDNKIMKLTMG